MSDSPWDDDPQTKSRKPKAAKKQKSGKVKAASNPAVSSYTYVDPEAPEDAQEYELKKKCNSQAEAERLAKAKLRELNKKVLTGDITLAGDPSLVAGEVVEISGFGRMDGKYILEEVRHTVSASGYTTACKVRRVNNSY